MAVLKTSPCPRCGRPVGEGKRCLYCQSAGPAGPSAAARPSSPGAPPAQAPPPLPPPAFALPPPTPSKVVLRIPAWAALLAVAALVAGLAALFRYSTYDGEALCVVNTTGRTDLDVYVDGKLRAAQVPPMRVEAKENARVLMLSPGSYHLETRDASGAVVDQVELEVTRHSHGYLYLPLRSPAACFALDTAFYAAPGAGGPVGGLEPLEVRGALTQFPSFVTRWFQENPPSVSVPKGFKSDFERALRLVACPPGERSADQPR